MRESHDSQRSPGPDPGLLEAAFGEMHGPLRQVFDSLDDMARAGVPRRQRQRLITARSSATVVRSLLDALHDLPADGRVPARRQRSVFRLQDAVDQVLGTLAPIASARGIWFRCTVEPAIGGRVEGDPVRLRQVLMYVTNLAMRLSGGGALRVWAMRDAPTPNGFHARFLVGGAASAASLAALRGMLGKSSASGGPGGALPPGVRAGWALHRRLARLIGGDLGIDEASADAFTLWVSAELCTVGTHCDQREHERRPQRVLRCNLGPVADLSLAGMRIRARRRRRGRMRVRVRRADLKLTCRARVVWDRPLGTDRHELGLQFLDLRPRQMEAIHRLTRET